MNRGGWAGTTLESRRAVRREQLLAAGLDLLGTQGSAAVTVRSVCRTSGLTDRYFYENFTDRDALLLAVYDAVALEAEQALLDAASSSSLPDAASSSSSPDAASSSSLPDAANRSSRADPPTFEFARRAVEAFLDVLTTDPRKGRVLLLEPLTDPVLGSRGAAVSPAFVSAVQAQLAGASEVDARLSATALVGAMANLFIRWLDGSLDVSRDVLTDYCVRLLVSTSALAARSAT